MKGSKSYLRGDALPKGGGKGSGGGKLGDWLCPACGASNFASSPNCERCGQPRDAGRSHPKGRGSSLEDMWGWDTGKGQGRDRSKGKEKNFGGSKGGKGKDEASLEELRFVAELLADTYGLPPPSSNEGPTHPKPESYGLPPPRSDKGPPRSKGSGGKGSFGHRVAVSQSRPPAGKGSVPDKSNKVLASSLPEDASEDSIRYTFQVYGEIVDVKMFEDRGKSSCLVTFANADAAHQALDNENLVDDTLIECRAVGAKTEKTSKGPHVAGHWTCEKCGELVFASKSQCNNCGAARPAGGRSEGNSRFSPY